MFSRIMPRYTLGMRRPTSVSARFSEMQRLTSSLNFLTSSRSNIAVLCSRLILPKSSRALVVVISIFSITGSSFPRPSSPLAGGGVFAFSSVSASSRSRSSHSFSSPAIFSSFSAFSLSNSSIAASTACFSSSVDASLIDCSSSASRVAKSSDLALSSSSAF